MIRSEKDFNVYREDVPVCAWCDYPIIDENPYQTCEGEPLCPFCAGEYGHDIKE